MNPEIDLLLASGSPRRSELLTLLGVRFRVLVTDLDESVLAGEAPEDYVQRLAAAKARAGWQACAGQLPTLGADTVVLLDGEILGKPDDRKAARSMLGRLSGRRHEVLSAVAVVDREGEVHACLDRSSVYFAPIPEDWIQAYCETPEPMDKAGAYAVQGLTAEWIRRIEGSYTGVMGLPLHETAGLLRRAGVRLALSTRAAPAASATG